MVEKNSSDNNMKIALVAIVILVIAVMGLVFALMQSKNSASTQDSDTEAASAEATSSGSQSSDADVLGKNEVKLTDANFKAEVEDYKGVVLVDFYLSTCPHCQNVAKDVTAVSDQLVGKAKVGKLEAKENGTNAEKYKIESVPTFIVFKEGKEVERVSGEKTKEELVAMVNKYLK